MYSNAKFESTIRYTPVEYPSYGGDQSASSNSSALPPKRQHLFSLGWIWEVLSTIGSAASMVAVIVILRLMQDKPYSEWPIGISLNAVIAVFVTASKSMAGLTIGACIAQSKWVQFKLKERKVRELDLYEDAARGPLGSLKLLGLVRWRTGIAALGAVATIVALGVDAFAQQVVELETKNIEVKDGRANFKLSHEYNGTATLQSQTGTSVDATTADIAMQGALFRGIYNMTIDPVYTCNSSCIWKESYISLGFRSQCIDVKTAALATNQKNESDYTNHMTTPSGISIGALYSYTSAQTKINIAATNILPPLFTPPDEITPEPEGQKFPPDFTRIAILRSPLQFDETPKESEYLSALEIYECTLSLTAYKYTNISASGANLTVRSDPIALKEATYKTIPNTTTGDGWLEFKQDGIPILKAKRVDLLALSQLFNSTRFAGKYDIGLVVKDTSGVGPALTTGDIPAVFDKMALSMTEQLRSNSAEAAEGFSRKPVVFVRVRWMWLGLPVGVVLATMVLLVGTVVNSWRCQVQLWKSSQAALLVHRVVVGERGGVLRADIRRLGDVEGFGKRVKVRLE